MKLAFITVFIVCCANMLFAQTERDNRAVYNRIEYFFNTQQVDSIYNLASAHYKAETELGSVSQWVSYFSQFGRITDARLSSYKQGIADYEVKIGEKSASIKLAIDSTFRYSLFQIEEIKNNTPQVKDAAVISKVEKVDELDDFVDSIARTYVQQLHTQSLAIGLITDNRVKTYFYGETEKGNETLPTASSMYEIGSITKLFTATLLANLAENGIIRLEDSIHKFLPDTIANNPFVQKITFKSLANHTSGLPGLPDNLKEVASFDSQNPYSSYGRKELFDFLKSFQSEAEPGEKFAYSNLGYGLLGELISIISDRPYHQLIQDSIAKPLGLANTVQEFNPETQGLITPHNSAGANVLPWTFQAISGAGALRSTINDLLKYAHIQFSIPKNRLEQAMMLTRQFSYFIPPDTDIGLAWHMNMVADIVTYWHNGHTAGSSSFIGLVPDNRSAIVVLSNSAIDVDEISKEILKKIIARN